MVQEPAFLFWHETRHTLKFSYLHPLYRVLARFPYQTDAFEDICDVVYSTFLGDIQKNRRLKEKLLILDKNAPNITHQFTCLRSRIPFSLESINSTNLRVKIPKDFSGRASSFVRSSIITCICPLSKQFSRKKWSRKNYNFIRRTPAKCDMSIFINKNCNMSKFKKKPLKLL